VCEMQRFVGTREVELNIEMALAKLHQAQHQPRQAETGGMSAAANSRS